MNPRSRDRVLFLLFFASGFCGLLYQVVWLRLAFASFGITTPVLSIVVSVFMLGLALGSWAAGRWVDAWRRRTGKSAAVLYGVTEVLIGTGAVAVPALFHAGSRALLPAGQTDSAPYLVLSALVIALSMLPWCTLMGATYPLMMSFVRETDRGQTTSFSFLYFANVLGAAVGTLATAVVLVECLGFAGTLLVAGAVNVLVALAAFRLAALHPASAAAAAAPAAVAAPASGDRFAAAILFVTGFCSMACEVVWTRSFTPVLRTYVYSFASLLAVYLVATFAGSWLYRRHLAKRAPASVPVLLGLLAIAAFLPIVFGDPRLLGTPAGVLATIVPYCAVLGYLTPMLVDRFSGGDPRAAGRAYAINVLGCILGPIAASYVLLPAFGAKFSLVALALPCAALFAAAAARDGTRIVRAVLVPGAVLAAAVSAFVSRSYEDAEWIDGRVLRRDHTATVVSHGTGMKRKLLVNGIGITVMDRCTKMMAHFPLAVHGHAKKALVICFGMGTTFRSLRSWDVDATAVELVPSVRDAFGYYHEDADAVLASPRAHVVVDDGRRFLARTGESFDVVTLDPPPPIEAAGSSLLYSKEFYELVKRRLAPGGILHQWYPGRWREDATSRAMLRSLVESFPHVRMYSSTFPHSWHMLASMEPIDVPGADVLVGRMPPAARADLVEWNPPGETDPVAYVAALLARREEPSEHLGTGDDCITDDRPFNEYYLVRRRLHRE